MLLLELILYCLLFFLLVKCAAKNSGRNCLYFYPKEYLAEAGRRGLADPTAEMKRGKRFMIPFCIIMLLALVAILALWNRVTEFRTAYWQSVLFLVVMNWFDGLVIDGLVIDGLWVGHSKIWRIAGMEGISYVKPWKTILTRRALATLFYLIFALALADIVVLIGKLL